MRVHRAFWKQGRSFLAKLGHRTIPAGLQRGNPRGNFPWLKRAARVLPLQSNRWLLDVIIPDWTLQA
jgi:hypothetical protein